MTSPNLKDFIVGALAVLIPMRARLPDDDPVVKRAVEENQRTMQVSIERSAEVSEQYRRTMAPINDLLENRIGSQNEDSR